jgi:hypothetical protein
MCPAEVPIAPVTEPEPVYVAEEEPAPKPSAWRNVRTRKRSQRDREEAMVAPIPLHPTGPLSTTDYAPPPRTAASWQSWRGNPTQVPSPSPTGFETGAPPVVSVRDRSPGPFGPTAGFFGPRPSAP